MGTISKRTFIILLFLLAGASSFLFLFKLGSSPLGDYDEAIYAQVMADTGHAGAFLTLYKGSGPWFEKPPLYFWLAISSEKIFEENAFALRLPAALCGIIGIILAVFLALELSGSYSASLLAGGILLTTGAFLEAGRQVRLDVPVAVVILFSLYSFVRAQKNPRWLIGIAPSIAIAVLLKSAVGAFGILLILVWALVHRDFSWLKNKFVWLGVLASLFLILPWHLYEGFQFGSRFWNDYLLHQVLDRFSSNVNGGVSSNWNYLRYTVLFTFPWMLLFAGGMFWMLRRETRRTKEWRGLAALGLGALLIFLLFGIAQTKLFYYIIPALPIVAVFCALCVWSMYRSCPNEYLQGALRNGVFLLLGIGLANCINVGYHFQSDFSEMQALVAEEYAVGSILAARPEPYEVKAFDYSYWDTIRYYSRGRDIAFLGSSDELTQPLFVVVANDSYDSKQFPAMLAGHITPLYTGKVLTLLLFRP